MIMIAQGNFEQVDPLVVIGQKEEKLRCEARFVAPQTSPQ